MAQLKSNLAAVVESQEKAIRRLYRMRQKLEEKELWYDLEAVVTVDTDDLVSQQLPVTEAALALG